jgi:hypothetical protein
MWQREHAQSAAARTRCAGLTRRLHIDAWCLRVTCEPVRTVRHRQVLVAGGNRYRIIGTKRCLRRVADERQPGNQKAGHQFDQEFHGLSQGAPRNGILDLPPVGRSTFFYTVVRALSALAHESRLAIFRALVVAGPNGMAALTALVAAYSWHCRARQFVDARRMGALVHAGARAWRLAI